MFTTGVYIYIYYVSVYIYIYICTPVLRLHYHYIYTHIKWYQMYITCTFTFRSNHTYYMYITCTLHVNYMYFACVLHVNCMSITFICPLYFRPTSFFLLQYKSYRIHMNVYHMSIVLVLQFLYTRISLSHLCWIYEIVILHCICIKIHEITMHQCITAHYMILH